MLSASESSLSEDGVGRGGETGPAIDFMAGFPTARRRLGERDDVGDGGSSTTTATDVTALLQWHPLLICNARAGLAAPVACCH